MGYYRGAGTGNHYQGDPFLGFLGGAVLKGATWLGKRIFANKPATPAGGLPAAQSRIPRFPLPPGGAGGRRMPLPVPIPFPGGMGAMGGASGCPKGYQPAKDPRTGLRTGHCVRIRRMNPTNPKALRRALRRAEGFGKLAQRAKKDVRRAASALGANPRRSTGARAVSRRGAEIVRVS